MNVSQVQVKCPYKPCAFVGMGLTTADARNALDCHIRAVHKPLSPQAQGPGQEVRRW